jgi:TolB protein
VRSVLYVICAIGVLACAGTVSSGAHAAFPGGNGKIAFVSTRDGNNEIYTMNADGSAQTDISNNPAGDIAPAWSSDGTRIAFASNRDGNFEIYKMNADGSAQTRLTNNAVADSVPAWTSDGRIVFNRGGGTGGCSPGAEIYIMNADGSGETNISNNAAVDCVPSGSVSGSIVFMSNRDNAGGELYTMNPDGSGVTRVTNNDLFDYSANWSPDATRFVLIGDENDVFVMQADGSGRTQLTFTANRLEFFPAWSPQGDKIVFDGSDATFQIYVMNPTGAGRLRSRPSVTTRTRTGRRVARRRRLLPLRRRLLHLRRRHHRHRLKNASSREC